jgi:hypothetical protein
MPITQRRIPWMFQRPQTTKELQHLEDVLFEARLELWCIAVDAELANCQQRHETKE